MAEKKLKTELPMAGVWSAPRCINSA